MSEMKRRPNVLVFIPHDLGDFLGCYGHASVKSPNIDRIAENGVRFTRYFTAAPECTPSRAGMMTGVYTHQNGLMGLCHRGWEFSSGTMHLARRLKEAGYETHLFGFQHETGMSPARLGYNNTHSQQDIAAPAVCASLLQFLRSPAARSDEPWFAYVGFHHVHRPWKEETSFDPLDVEVPPTLPDMPEVRRDLARFHQAIAEMDGAIGPVLDELRESGLDVRTATIFTTDHGAPFPRAKSTFYDPGIRIPFLLSYGDKFGRGRTCDALLSNLDFTPTILELCGERAPDGLEGRSFLSLLEGGEYQERDAVYGALYYDAFYDPMCYVRTGKYKYIRSFAVTPEEAKGADREVLACHKTGTWIRADDSDVQSSLTWQAMNRVDYPVPAREELYDLDRDPLEQSNLAEEPGAAPILEEMRSLLRKMMEKTACPLLSGHISPDLSRTRNRRG